MDTADTHIPWRLVRWFVVASLALFLVFGIDAPRALRAENERVITIYHDGIEQTLVTDAPTLEEALKRGDVAVNEHDVVEPELSTKLIAPSYYVNIFRARPITVVDGAQRQQVVSAHSSARQIAADAGIKLFNEDTYDLSRIDNFVAEDGIGLKLTIKRSVPVKFLLYGKEVTMRTMAKTVGEFVQANDLRLMPKDKLWPSPDTPIAAEMTVALYAEGTMEITEEPVPFGIKKIQDADQPLGYKKVQTPGQDGRRFVIYKVEGDKRTVMQSYTLVQPKEQIEVVGAKGNDFGGDLNNALTALRGCEAGGRYDRNSGNGYYGAYQFNPTTWRGHAPEGWKDVLPNAAPPAVQDAAAVHLYNARGWQPWPGCTRKLGLQDIYR